MSFLTQSHQVFFKHPLCLIPSTSHVIQRLTQSFHLFVQHVQTISTYSFLITKLTGSNHLSNKIQNVDILVPANPGPPGRVAIRTQSRYDVGSYILHMEC